MRDATLRFVALVAMLGVPSCFDDTRDVPVGPLPEQMTLIPQTVVHVPAGAFLRGCIGENPEYPCVVEGEGDNRVDVPARDIYLSEFWIDKYEVSARHYKLCMDAGVCRPLSPAVYYFTYSEPINPDTAVGGISWLQAENYCRWRGMRLPTEAEWEKAARGTDGRRFAWGNEEPGCGDVNLLYPDDAMCGDEYPYIWPRSMPGRDISPYGAVHMTGNCWEWLADYFHPDAYEKADDVDPVMDVPHSDSDWASHRALRVGDPQTTVRFRRLSRRHYGEQTFRDVRYSVRCVTNDPTDELIVESHVP